jgi:hypothetical protein
MIVSIQRRVRGYNKSARFAEMLVTKRYFGGSPCQK